MGCCFICCQSGPLLHMCRTHCIAPPPRLYIVMTSEIFSNLLDDDRQSWLDGSVFRDRLDLVSDWTWSQTEPHGLHGPRPNENTVWISPAVSLQEEEEAGHLPSPPPWTVGEGPTAWSPAWTSNTKHSHMWPDGGAAGNQYAVQG